MQINRFCNLVKIIQKCSRKSFHPKVKKYCFDKGEVWFEFVDQILDKALIEVHLLSFATYFVTLHQIIALAILGVKTHVILRSSP